MQCQNCKRFDRRNVWKCPDCGTEIKGGIVFVTGISGSAVNDYLKQVSELAMSHGHLIKLHDIGEIMQRYAEDDNPDVHWEWILNADEGIRRHLRALAFLELTHEIKSSLDTIYIVDLHLCFRWKAYLMKGFEPHVLEGFKPFVRFFVNFIEDLNNIKNRLSQTTWRNREILELLIWRDEELFLTDLFSDVCGRVKTFAIAAAEPPQMLENLIWHPEIKKVYLSFPITNLPDENAKEEIRKFRDKIREFLVVFDPYASKDYDETYTRPEMTSLRKKVGEATEDRDYRFIDQADALVVYFPKKVDSKGVDKEMGHAKKTGKTIYLYCPEDLGGGPFAVPPSHYRTNPDDFFELLKQDLSPI